MSKQVKYVYMCGIDWQHEMSPELPNAPDIFYTVKALKKARNCWVECGIVRLKVELDKWSVEQDLWNKNAKRNQKST